MVRPEPASHRPWRWPWRWHPGQDSGQRRPDCIGGIAMRRRALPGHILAVALAARTARAAVPAEAASLAPLLQPMLARFGLPALAAAAVQDGRIIAAGSVGTRRWG